MPKEYSTWLSEMSGTIPDNSEFIKPSYDITTLTNAQRRMHVADLLVKSCETEGDVDDWVTVFCIGLSGERGNMELCEMPSSVVMGLAEKMAYCNTVGDTQSLAWLYQFKEKIIMGRIS